TGLINTRNNFNAISFHVLYIPVKGFWFKAFHSNIMFVFDFCPYGGQFVQFLLDNLFYGFQIQLFCNLQCRKLTTVADKTGIIRMAFEIYSVNIEVDVKVFFVSMNESYALPVS